MNKSIIHMRPSEIEKEEDIIKRKKFYKKFFFINEMFVDPLVYLLYLEDKQNISIIEEIKELSIVERILLLRKKLLAYGYHLNELKALVPKNHEEINQIKVLKKKKYEVKEDSLWKNIKK